MESRKDTSVYFTKRNYRLIGKVDYSCTHPQLLVHTLIQKAHMLMRSPLS